MLYHTHFCFAFRKTKPIHKIPIKLIKVSAMQQAIKYSRGINWGFNSKLIFLFDFSMHM